MNHIQIPFSFIKGKVTEVGKCFFFFGLKFIGIGIINRNLFFLKLAAPIFC